jgi:TfoX/Sxy family transcriptional regulator of competence genes
MSIPRPDEVSRALFMSFVPHDSRIKVKKVFGNDAAFVNGNMFFGLYGKNLYLRLPEDDAKEFLSTKGTKPFEPMPGRAMKGYFVIPRSWLSRPLSIREWISRSLDWASKLPPK